MSAREYQEVYQDLGIDTNKLGCIMVNTAPIEVSSLIDADDLHYDKADEFARGIVSESVPHVTLLYGLLSGGPAMQKHVDRVLDGWSIDNVQITDVTAFTGNPDYSPLVAEVAIEELLEDHQPLQLLAFPWGCLTSPVQTACGHPYPDLCLHRSGLFL